MRVLIRRFGEIFRIGSEVTIRVLETTCHRVRMAVDTPPGIRVVREETYRAILRENQKAALTGCDVMEAAAALVGDRRPRQRGPGSKMLH